jgi:hypothetical protein
LFIVLSRTALVFLKMPLPEDFNPKRHGLLAYTAQGECINLEVLQSAAGFYIGTATPEGAPNTRESACYWPRRPNAVRALKTGDWPQKCSL